MLYHAKSCEGLRAPKGREYFALLISEEMSNRLRDLPSEDIRRLEQWLREDIELAGHLVPAEPVPV